MAEPGLGDDWASGVPEPAAPLADWDAAPFPDEAEAAAVLEREPPASRSLLGAVGSSLLGHCLMLAATLCLVGFSAAPPPPWPEDLVMVDLLPGPPPGLGSGHGGGGAGPAGPAAEPSPSPPAPIPAPPRPVLAPSPPVIPPPPEPPSRPVAKPKPKPMGLAKKVNPKPLAPVPPEPAVPAAESQTEAAVAPAGPVAETAVVGAGRPGEAQGSGWDGGGGGGGFGRGEGIAGGGGGGGGGGIGGGGPDTPAQALHRSRPNYPSLARRRGIEGRVVVRLLVDREGRVSGLAILDAQPSGYFEEAVKAAVPHWRFQPARKDGKSVAMWLETTIRFKLE